MNENRRAKGLRHREKSYALRNFCPVETSMAQSRSVISATGTSTMPPKQTQTSQAWSQKEREDFRNYVHTGRQEGEQLEVLLYREKRDIEGLQGMAHGAQQQTTITDFSRPESDVS